MICPWAGNLIANFWKKSNLHPTLCLPPRRHYIDRCIIPAEACGLQDDVIVLCLASSTTPRRRNLLVALAQYTVTHFWSSSTKSLSWFFSSLIPALIVYCKRSFHGKVESHTKTTATFENKLYRRNVLVTSFSWLLVGCKSVIFFANFLKNHPLFPKRKEHHGKEHAC